MLGYRRRPRGGGAGYRGEWFFGGDLAHVDADGYVWFHGRADDLLNAMGYRVSPLEMEAVLADHPSVAEVAVGELAVSPEVTSWPPSSSRTGAADEQRCSLGEAALAAYKRPRKVVFVDPLPRTRPASCCGGSCRGGWKTSAVARMIRRSQRASLVESGLRRPL